MPDEPAGDSGPVPWFPIIVGTLFAIGVALWALDELGDPAPRFEGPCWDAYEYHLEQAAYERGENQTAYKWHKKKAEAYNDAARRGGECREWQEHKLPGGRGS